MSLTTSLAPRSASSSACARPRLGLPPAPVTTAVRPPKRSSAMSLGHFRLGCFGASSEPSCRALEVAARIVDEHLVDVALRNARFEQRGNYVVVDVQVIMVRHGSVV